MHNDPATWTTFDINLILIDGDAQYHASYKKLKRDGRTPQTRQLLPTEVYPYIKIGRTFLYLNAIDNVESNTLKWDNLVKSLNQFFKDRQYRSGIFSCNNFSFAIFQNSESFFLLNSHATSYAGESMGSRDDESAACLMQTFTIQCLAGHLIAASYQGNNILDEADRHPTLCYSITNFSISKIVFGKDISTRRKVYQILNNPTSKARKRKSIFFADEHSNLKSRRMTEPVRAYSTINDVELVESVILCEFYTEF